MTSLLTTPLVSWAQDSGLPETEINDITAPWQEEHYIIKLPKELSNSATITTHNNIKACSEFTAEKFTHSSSGVSASLIVQPNILSDFRTVMAKFSATTFKLRCSHDTASHFKCVLQDVADAKIPSSVSHTIVRLNKTSNKKTAATITLYPTTHRVQIQCSRDHMIDFMNFVINPLMKLTPVAHLLSNVLSDCIECTYSSINCILSEGTCYGTCTQIQARCTPQIQAADDEITGALPELDAFAPSFYPSSKTNKHRKSMSVSTKQISFPLKHLENEVALCKSDLHTLSCSISDEGSKLTERMNILNSANEQLSATLSNVKSANEQLSARLSNADREIKSLRVEVATLRVENKDLNEKIALLDHEKIQKRLCELESRLAIGEQQLNNTNQADDAEIKSLKDEVVTLRSENKDLNEKIALLDHEKIQKRLCDLESRLAMGKQQLNNINQADNAERYTTPPPPPSTPAQAVNSVSSEAVNNDAFADLQRILSQTPPTSQTVNEYLPTAPAQGDSQPDSQPLMSVDNFSGINFLFGGSNVHLIKNLILNRTSKLVINAKSGATFSSLYDEISQIQRCNTLIIQGGVNDAAQLNDATNAVPDLQRLLSLANEKANRVILFAPPPVSDAVIRMEDVMYEEAARFNIEFISTSHIFPASGPRLVKSDNLHCTKRGAGYYGNTLVNYLKEYTDIVSDPGIMSCINCHRAGHVYTSCPDMTSSPPQPRRNVHPHRPTHQPTTPPIRNRSNPPSHQRNDNYRDAPTNSGRRRNMPSRQTRRGDSNNYQQSRPRYHQRQRRPVPQPPGYSTYREPPTSYNEPPPPYRENPPPYSNIRSYERRQSRQQQAGTLNPSSRHQQQSYNVSPANTNFAPPSLPQPPPPGIPTRNRFSILVSEV